MSDAAPPPPKLGVQLAATMVWRMQHEGSHEQDRWDAMAWLELMGVSTYERCDCQKCAKLWAKPGLAASGSLVGTALAARTALTPDSRP